MSFGVGIVSQFMHVPCIGH